MSDAEELDRRRDQEARRLAKDTRRQAGQTHPCQEARRGGQKGRHHRTARAARPDAEETRLMVMASGSLGVIPARLAATSRRIQGFVSGGTTTNPTANQVLAYHCACVPGVIRIVVAAASVSGGTATILDVRKNGT